MAFLVLGACLNLLAFSPMPLWRWESPDGPMADMRPGTFWDFLKNVPRAIEDLSTPQEPEIILTILPSVYFWENVRTTLILLALGALGGLAVWLFWWRGRRRPHQPSAQ
jgi:hypothetical protein